MDGGNAVGARKARPTEPSVTDSWRCVGRQLIANFVSRLVINAGNGGPGVPYALNASWLSRPIGAGALRLVGGDGQLAIKA
jgi:hypothetical protein